ncbi:MAG: leucine-rich repeat domain-containing protein [Candidatus Hermodarchaeota archaeon]
MYCPNCGEKLEEDFKYCPYCEADLAIYKQKSQKFDNKDELRKKEKDIESLESESNKVESVKYEQKVEEPTIKREDSIKGMVVEYRGKEYSVKERAGLLTLKLSDKKIDDIAEIRGLNLLSGLEVLQLDHNNLTKINGLDSLKSLRILDLSSNKITKIEGFEQLSNLEELNLELNQIQVLESLDQLTKLRELNFFGNKISRIESFENKDRVKRFLLDTTNPVYREILNVLGIVNVRTVSQYAHMSDEEKKVMRRKTEEVEFNRSQEKYKHEIEKKKQEKIYLTLTVVIGVVLGLIGALLLFNSLGGIFAMFSGGSFPPSTITAIVLLILGFILVSIGSKGDCCDAACDCC